MIEHKNKIGLIQIIAALLIVNHHTSFLEIPYVRHLTKGGFVVNMIFVYLSGYLLAKSYSNNVNIDCYTFLKRRFIRIYPSLHISIVLIFIIYFFIGIEISYHNIILSLTGFQYFFGITSFGPQFWFVSIILACYILCIPTIHFLNSKPNYFYISLSLLIILILALREESLYGIYTKVNDDCIYRFIFHYIIFSIGLHISIMKKDVEIFAFKPALFIFFTALSIYIVATINQFFDIIKILADVMMAFSLITLISSSYNFFIKKLPALFVLSSITYEIYLIHVAVIYLFNFIAPQKLYSYPLVFVVSIIIAFIISKLSAYYLQYMEKLLAKTD